jgi:hypothetical protein
MFTFIMKMTLNYNFLEGRQEPEVESKGALHSVYPWMV